MTDDPRDAFRALFPTDALSLDAAAYAVEGLTPRLALRPPTAEAIAATLRLAEARGLAVVPWGGGTQMGLGAPPSRYDLALDLRGLDRIVEYEPADLTVTVEAGIALSTLQQLLGEHGQWLPLDPWLPPEATIGGILATNASGPTRLAHGSARDLLIGIRVATADGELIKSGGRVVKNVAGYDLGKLQIGALGTLGVIVQAAFKVSPLPARVANVTIKGDFGALISNYRQIAAARLSVKAMVLSREAVGRDWRLQVRLGGGAAAVERSLRDLESLAGTAPEVDGPKIDLEATLLLANAEVVVRAGVVPSTLPELLQRLAEAGATVYGLPAPGSAVAAWRRSSEIDSAGLQELRRQATDAGKGALVIEKAPPELKRGLDVWGPARPDFWLMRALKDQFDPHHILNPGRYLGGI
jgi:glycolate oxidase FAD binding subunit